MSNWSKQALERVFSQLQVIQDGRLLSVDVVQSCILTLELIYREFVSQASLVQLTEDEEDAAQYILEALQLLVNTEERLVMTSTTDNRYTPPYTPLWESWPSSI